LITLDPAHFHAALLQREMLPGVDRKAHVYAPLGPDLAAHLTRLAQFNSRREAPTAWELEVHAGADFLARFLSERPGNVVVLSGRNQAKLAHLTQALEAGLHVLADKPWILEPGDLPGLKAALELATKRGLVAYDAMTQRFEVTCRLQRLLVNSPAIFGRPLEGSIEQPAVRMESVHYLVKEVAGAPSLRPAWFFDVRQQGEGLTDVGTHLVDLAQWILFPDQAIDVERDVRVLQAAHWPTTLTLEEFRRATGEREFPACVADSLQAGKLQYMANNEVHYALRGIHVRLLIRWDLAPPPGGRDTELAVFSGSLSRVEVRQGAEQQFTPEVCVIPNSTAQTTELRRALDGLLPALRREVPGLEVVEAPGQFRLAIPPAQRASHEAHFSMLVSAFLDYVRNPGALPAWEQPNLLAKYHVTTRGVALARQTEKPADHKPTHP